MKLKMCLNPKVLSRLSEEYGFSVSTVDLATPEEATFAWHGGVLIPPGIFIDGEPFSYGRASERKLRHELDRRADGNLATGDESEGRS